MANLQLIMHDKSDTAIPNSVIVEWSYTKHKTPSTHCGPIFFVRRRQIKDKSQKRYLAIYTWQMTEVSNRRSDNRGNHADLWPLKVSAIARSNGSTLLKFVLITQREVHLINTTKARKGLSYRTENGKCTNAKSRNEGTVECRNHGTAENDTKSQKMESRNGGK